MVRIAVAVSAMAPVLVACADPNEPEPPSGHALYGQYCVVCHGETGRGDGILSSDLPVRPADLTQIAARNGGVSPWSEVMAQIHGYKGRSEVMPEFGTLLEGPSVMWKDETGTRIETPFALLALAEYLAEIQE